MFWQLIAVAIVAASGQRIDNPQWNRRPTGDPPRNRELKLIHIIYRHGIRTPADTYPNDPYANSEFYPSGWGQLTNDGKRKLFEHGLFLRNRYGHFIGTHYSPDIYYVQTTGVDRTKMTAQCINAGFWAPNNDQYWGILNWQPIPVNSEPLDTDNLLLVRRPCPQYHLELEKVEHSPEIQRQLQEEGPLFTELSRITGKNIKNFEDVQDVYTTLMAEEAFGLPLPDWTRQYYPHRMLKSTELSFVLNVYNDRLSRFKGGVLLKKMIEDWKSVADGTLKPKQRKAFLYIGHDTTVVNILSALKLWHPQVPGFAINTFFEFSQDLNTKEYGVEVFFRNSTDPHAVPYQLTIPNCEKFCPLDRLIQLTSSVVPDDWEEECKSDDPNFTVPPPRPP
ncbi:hypothetical protein PPYR_03397 [Photinus pyralis]|uniref:Acid phosphatase n=1 Tax=Photinus pyralis TaxID=7054 RepID=A0A5N4A2Q3_PHOPY|nr:lysosomal acid phosphatase-like [Photinus pyralis]KAB0791597.1 hypothetical protein PPYR_03397 [Photinus pyralis]